ncbi:hypothetical protein [Inquilinus limosus]|uniref:hypothetical protein n=1 Tax=Inquilinus limosus TaxID=171674 RepID=UPI0015C62E8E|nr:hypothetical protein [Inquilinus limosus]
MMIVIGETGCVAATVTAGGRHRAARSGRALDRPEMYTVRYRTHLMQREPRAGDEVFR